MARPDFRWECPDQWSEWSEWLAAGLHARNRWRLPVLLVGILFANGRRTVTSWLRAAGISDDYYYFLSAVGRKANSIATRVEVQAVTCASRSGLGNGIGDFGQFRYRLGQFG